MEVKINIEANQIGDTVIDLFKNLPEDKKEELALTVMKEWLRDPSFFETKTREAIIIEEFRQGKRSPAWGRDKYDTDTDVNQIRRDDNYQKAVLEYKTSKQIMVEDLKNEVVKYYKEQIAKELVENEVINRIKQDTFNAIASDFPNIINQVMIQVFANSLQDLRGQIGEMYWKSDMQQGVLQNIQSKLNLY